MKIIHIQECRIIYNEEKIRIKTPIGVFNNINDAIEVYPYIDEAKRIKQCPICNTYFIDKATNNNMKYCSEECYNKGQNINKREYYYNRIFTGQGVFYPDQYLQRIRDHNNRDYQKDKSKLFIQDDNYWGLGESNLSGHIANNFEYEHEYIKREKKRLLNRR